MNVSDQMEKAKTPDEMRAKISRLRFDNPMVATVMDMADIRGLSAEDRYTVLAYYALRELIMMHKR